MAKLKETVKTKDVDGNELVLDVRHPSGQQLAESQMKYSSEWNRAVKNGCLPADLLDDELKKMGLWDDSKEKEKEKILLRLEETRRKLKKGGIKKSEAKQYALGNLEDMSKFRNLVSKKNRLEATTAEAHANNAQFNYLVSVCVVYNNDGKHYFKSYEDYLERVDEQAARDSAEKLYGMLHSTPNSEDLEEVKFLKKYGFINDKGFLLNGEGHAVDDEGRYVDSEGRYIDGKGGYIDKFGNPVDADGEAIVEFSPFLDDEGEPIPELPAAV